MPDIVFRCDASAETGGGHATRCLVLAKAMLSEGWTCSFAVNPEAPVMIPSLSEFPLEMLLTGEESAQMVARWPEGCRILVVDHYRRDAAFERSCQPWADSVVVIDDLADRPHVARVLVDQNLGRDKIDYVGLVPEDCQILTGPAYAMLRAQFRMARPTALTRRGANPARRLLVAVGLGDHQDLTSRALEALMLCPDLSLDVDIAIGNKAPALDRVRALAAGLPKPARVLIDVGNIAKLMVQADLCVGAAGTSSWERCCLGLPTLLFTAAENQALISRAVVGAGAAVPLGWCGEFNATEIADILRSVASDGELLARMAAQAFRICDGRGAGRVLCALVAPKARNGSPVRLRPAVVDDVSIVFDWQNNPETRRYFRNPSVPSEAEHRKWWASRLECADPGLEIVMAGETPVGLVRLDHIAASGPTNEMSRPSYEVSILTAPGHTRQGYARTALSLLRRIQQEADLLAVVLPGNKASAALFSTAGYGQRADGLFVSLGAAVS